MIYLRKFLLDDKNYNIEDGGFNLFDKNTESIALLKETQSVKISDRRRNMNLK